MALLPIETNLFDFFTDIHAPTVIDKRVEDDVIWFTSEIAFPLLNGAMAARFEAEASTHRTHEVLDDLMNHGNPFLWWLTPNTRSTDLEGVLVERGLAADESNNAMSLDLRAAALDEKPGPGVTIEPMSEANTNELTLAMLDGFGMPRDLTAPFLTFLNAPTSARVSLHSVLARLDGEPVGAGSVVVSDRTVAGLYNIAVLEGARGRGVGRAVTVELMRIGVAQGCTESILHASTMGEPVYAKLGFRTVGQVTQYAWAPEETS